MINNFHFIRLAHFESSRITVSTRKPVKSWQFLCLVNATNSFLGQSVLCAFKNAKIETPVLIYKCLLWF